MPQQFSDNNIDKAFREKLSGLRTQPRSRVWYRVSAGLDRDASLLAHKKRRVIGVLVGLLILSGIILSAVLDPIATRKKISKTIGEIPKEIGVLNQNSTIAISNSEGFILNNLIITDSAPIIFNSDNSYAVIMEESISELIVVPVQLKNEKFNELRNLPVFLSLLKENDKGALATKYENSNFSMNKISSPDNVNVRHKYNCLPRFYSGVNIKFNRTSLVDASVIKNIDFIDKFHIQKAISVYTGYRITKNISAELGWNLFSNEGQSYGFTSLSRKSTVTPTRNDYEIKLRYTQIPLKVRYDFETWSGLFNTPVTYSLAIGAMYGKLLESHFLEGDMDVSTQLRKSEIAGVLNLAADVKIYKRISLSTGVEASYSNNILQPNKIISPFIAPHNFVIGATAGLVVSIGKKTPCQ